MNNVSPSITETLSPLGLQGSVTGTIAEKGLGQDAVRGLPGILLRVETKSPNGNAKSIAQARDTRDCGVPRTTHFGGSTIESQTLSGTDHLTSWDSSDGTKEEECGHVHLGLWGPQWRRGRRGRCRMASSYNTSGLSFGSGSRKILCRIRRSGMVRDPCQGYGASWRRRPGSRGGASWDRSPPSFGRAGKPHGHWRSPLVFGRSVRLCRRDRIFLLRLNREYWK